MEDSLIHQEFNNEELKNAPQVKTDYGLYVYRKEVITLIKGNKKRAGVTDVSYKKVNRKSYKNLKWLDRMYEKWKDNLSDEVLFKVIMPLEFPKGYKLYDHNGDYYATIIDKNDIFLLVVTRYNKTPSFFLEKKLFEYYAQSHDGKYGLTVPLEFVENFERKD